LFPSGNQNQTHSWKKHKAANRCEQQAANKLELLGQSSSFRLLTVTSIETEGHSLQMLKLATCIEAATIHQRQQFTITIRAVFVKQFRVYFSIYPQKHFKLCAGVFNDAKFGNILVIERCNFGLAANQLFYLENVNYREEFADFQKKKRADGPRDLPRGGGHCGRTGRHIATGRFILIDVYARLTLFGAVYVISATVCAPVWAVVSASIWSPAAAVGAVFAAPCRRSLTTLKSEGKQR
ncbi:hypothetical protein TYRP_005304, partial [Tyrophagus putrescentiae]